LAKEPTPVRSNSPAPSGGGANDGEVGYDGIKVALKDLRISSAEADDDFIVKTYRKPKSTANGLNMREFLFFFITKLTDKISYDLKIENSFEDLRKKVHELFEYLDCDGDGTINSTDIYHGF